RRLSQHFGVVLTQALKSSLSVVILLLTQLIMLLAPKHSHRFPSSMTKLDFDTSVNPVPPGTIVLHKWLASWATHFMGLLISGIESSSVAAVNSEDAFAASISRAVAQKI
nr:hypothetical protein [Gammaproteobacteria bacterium]